MPTPYKKAKLNVEEPFEIQRGIKVCAENEEYYQYDVSDYIKYCTDPAYRAACEQPPNNHNENQDGTFERIPLPKQLIQAVKRIAYYPEPVLKNLESSISRKYLKLKGYKINAEDINGYIVPFLEQHPDIIALDLEGNFFGDRGAAALACLALNKLNVSFNEITDLGAIEIAKIKNLHTLEITNNKIGNKGAVVLAANPALKTLNISYNKIRNEGGMALANNRTLEILDIYVQKMNKKGTEAFLSNETLTFLKIFLFAKENLQQTFQTQIPLRRKEKDKQRKKAFLMGTHSKAGENSPILSLYRHNEKLLMREILSYIEPAPLTLRFR